MFFIALFAVSSIAVAQTPVTPLSEAERQAAISEGTTLGVEQGELGATNQPQFDDEGNEHGEGRVLINGEWRRTSEVVGGKHDETKAATAKSVDAHKSMDDLRAVHDAEAAEIAAEGQSTSRGKAYGTAWEAQDKVEQGKVLVQDTNWDKTLEAFGGARDGRVLGDRVAQCDTTTTVTPSTRDVILKDQEVCEKVVLPTADTDGEICVRERTCTSERPIEAHELSALVDVGGGENTTVCTRETVVESYQDDLSQTRTGELDITNEVGGLSCRRTVWPLIDTGETAVSHDATLPIDTQAAGNICTREAWPTATATPQSGSKSGVLGVNNESGGNLCSRTVWPTDATSNQPGTKSATLLIDDQVPGSSCTRERTVSLVGGGPTNVVQDVTLQMGGIFDFLSVWLASGPGVGDPGANLTVVSYTKVSGHACHAITSLGLPEFVPALGYWIISGMQNPSCPAGESVYRFTFSVSGGEPTKNFSVSDSGNCSSSGTANCPMNWTCTGNAPATIGGIAVTAAEVQALGALYPGAPNTCISATRTSSCSGSANVSNSISIADQIPPGTSTITGFSYFVSNPQPGVAVTLTQTPSAGNGWVAQYSVTRSDFSYTPVQPNIVMNWNSVIPGSSITVQDTGNCSAGGSTHCPAQWTCTSNAPQVINGINVTPALALQVAPLFPGASNTCTTATRSAVCGGSAQDDTVLTIADQIPGGVTSITNFNFTVTNPQAGVSVSLVTAPTQANGWNATFRVTRTNWASVPANPQINMTWDMMVPGVAIAPQDTGDCSASGTANCPAAWTCTATAPTTINGITVTPALAASIAPLFPGAANNCARGSRDRVCSGSATVDTSIDLSSRMPDGTTSISSFTHSILNPQAGVSTSVVQAPTLGNGWVAIFRTTRTQWASQPNPVDIRITWNATHPITVTTVQDDGNCSDTGSTACPTQWSCPIVAPHVVNGINVTAALAGSQAPLYPGAPTNCVEAALTRVCNGSSSVISSIGIGDLLPVGTTSIRSFSWTWDNPQAALGVVLVSAPTEANGWAAQFEVTRNYALGGTPPRPSITLTWNVDSEMLYRAVVNESGDCDSGTESAFCPLSWECTRTGPGMVGGHNVTLEMLAIRGPLYEGDGPPAVCLDANYGNRCVGGGEILTEIRLNHLIPEWVETLESYTWEVSIPVSGVNLDQVQAPTKENNWRAIFRAARTNWSGGETKPQVTLRWEHGGAWVHTCEIQETGDCSLDSDDFCHAEWTCTDEAEDPPGASTPVVLSSVVTDPMLFAYARPGQPYESVVEFPAGLVPAGTTSIDNFSWQVTSSVGTGGCYSNVVGKPAPGNLRTNVLVTAGSGGGGGGGRDPGDFEHVVIASVDKSPAPLRLLEGVLEGLIPSAMAQPSGCGVYIVFRWDNIGVTEGGGSTFDPGPFAPDIESLPPLFEGDGGKCMRASKAQQCNEIWVGEECDDNSEGDEYCVNQPPTEGIPNTCGELEAAPNCTLIREECAEGGMTLGGWCYVRSYLYQCERTIQVDSPIITRETVCDGGEAGMPPVCQDGTCVMPGAEEPVSTDVDRAGARMLIIQHQMKDFKIITSSPVPPGGGGPPETDLPIINIH